MKPSLSLVTEAETEAIIRRWPDSNHRRPTQAEPLSSFFFVTGSWLRVSRFLKACLNAYNLISAYIHKVSKQVRELPRQTRTLAACATRRVFCVSTTFFQNLPTRNCYVSLSARFSWSEDL